MPFVGSLLFAIIWMAVFISEGRDTQAVVQTAFSVASYLVTAGTSKKYLFFKFPF